jgi:hypothetical protein
VSSLIHEDLHLVLSRLPKDVASLLRDTPSLMLAGGFIRSTITGEPVSDIDLFGPSKEMLQSTAMAFALARKGRFHETQNAFTVLTAGRHAVQFIHRWTYTEPAAVLPDFDFSIAQAVVWWLPGDIKGEWCSAIADSYYADLASKRLRYLAPKRAEDAGGSLLRARKFIKRGYHIEAHSLAKVIARATMGVRQIANAIGEDEFGSLLTAVLREVDPLTVVDGLDLVDEHQTTADIGSAKAEDSPL